MRALFLFISIFLIFSVQLIEKPVPLRKSEIKLAEYSKLLNQIRHHQNKRLQLKEKLVRDGANASESLVYELRYLRRLSNSLWSNKWQLLAEIKYLRELEKNESL